MFGNVLTDGLPSQLSLEIDLDLKLAQVRRQERP